MYRMYLILGNRELEFPVLPEELAVSSPGHNETATVLELGEVTRLRKKGLQEISVSSLFPVNPSAPYVTGRSVLSPMEYVDAIQEWRDQKKRARFLLLGSELDLNLPVSVERLDYEERGGETGDIYYTLKLKEWRSYGAVTLELPETRAAPRVSQAQREGSPEPASTHTVVAGDCLWAIAKQHYGDGGRYPELYKKNKALIDGANRGTGNPTYTIYAGQKLVL